jgi:hypothetical protein
MAVNALSSVSKNAKGGFVGVESLEFMPARERMKPVQPVLLTMAKRVTRRRR